MFRLVGEWSASAPTVYTYRLYDDLGLSSEMDWLDLLDGATTLTVDWSTDAGLTWRSVPVNLDHVLEHPRCVMNVAKRFADGTTEYLVRFVIDGVTWGPLVFRFGN